MKKVKGQNSIENLAEWFIQEKGVCVYEGGETKENRKCGRTDWAVTAEKELEIRMNNRL